MRLCVSAIPVTASGEVEIELRSKRYKCDSDSGKLSKTPARLTIRIPQIENFLWTVCFQGVGLSEGLTELSKKRGRLKQLPGSIAQLTS